MTTFSEAVAATKGRYRCTDCDVQGTGTECWLCGSAVFLTPVLWQPAISAGPQSFITIEEALRDEEPETP